MNYEKEFNMNWVSLEDTQIVHKSKTLEMLEHELADIQNNIEQIEEKQRVLANLSMLYARK